MLNYIISIQENLKLKNIKLRLTDAQIIVLYFMSKSLIIIPSRLKALRLPGKPLKMINNLPMIIQVYRKAVEANVGEVIIASPDKEIINVGKKFSCNTILTKDTYKTGTDRVFAAYKNIKDKNIDQIINLQGDMPNINPKNIKVLDNLIRQKNIKIGTLASSLLKEELHKKSVVKVLTKEALNNKNFLKVKDFFRVNNNLKNKYIYHHIGIYGFKTEVLNKYTKLNQSENEKSRNLEQMRALDNNIDIHVAFTSSIPLSVDTEDELVEIKKLMEYKS